MSNVFTLENAMAKLKSFEEQLAMIVPDPNRERLLELNREYTPDELKALLQKFSSYLASLDAWEGRLEAECHILRKGLATGIAVASARLDSKDKTVSGREAEVLSENEGLRQCKILEIESGANLLIIQGWRKAYSDAYVGVSRIVSLVMGEMDLTPGIRVP